VLQRAQRQYVGHLSQDPVTRGDVAPRLRRRRPAPKTDVVTRLQTRGSTTSIRCAMVQDLADHQPIDYTKNGYVLARLARGASAKADGFLEHGVRAADGTFIAPALEPALKPVKGQMREFAGYLARCAPWSSAAAAWKPACRSPRRRRIVAKFKSPTFDAARDAVYAYQDGLLATRRTPARCRSTS
jgi:hypothetical protein